MGFRSVSMKLLQNRLTPEAASYKFKRLESNEHFADSKRYTSKHVFKVHPTPEQGRLHRRILPAGPQRAPSPNSKASRQNHPQLRQGRSARPPGAGAALPLYRPRLRAIVTDPYDAPTGCLEKANVSLGDGLTIRQSLALGCPLVIESRSF